MRILLVDNYDSYSYNLFQLLAVVTGEEPLVLSNNAPELAGLDLGAFDAIVVSPGPGHPGRARDLGPHADRLAACNRPILGVCLGHQAIAASAGARVDRALCARHGHLSTIWHDGRDLFAGLPQGFTGVRYHSLSVHEPLPADLEVTAWAEDGVVMGVRHRSLPRWGVQFHPESVCTEYGTELVRNFITLVRERGVVSGAPPAPASPAVPAARTSPPRYRLHVRTLPWAVDTEEAFRTLFAGSEHAFWLDSSRVEPGLSRFSFLGDASGPLSEVVRYRVGSGQVEVTAADGTVRHVPGSVLDYLDTELSRRQIPDPGLPFDFVGGYVGYFGYELRADCGSPLSTPSTGDDAAWIFADRLLAVDHAEDTTRLLCLSSGSEDGARAEEWLRATAQELISAPTAAVPEPASDGRGSVIAPLPGAHRLVEDWLVRNEAHYRNDVRRCREQLLAGESYEICLTNSVQAPVDADPLEVHTTLRRSNPAPYAAFLRIGPVAAACSSPERFLRVTPDGTVESKPIKGTAPRRADPIADDQQRRSLALDPKSQAENLMIVDLLRNDLGRVCRVGSVHVPVLMQVESYATVHQLVSTVRGRLRDGAGPVDCVRAGFPGGSMTGAPKPRTMEIIDALEGRPRGMYSGSIGYLGLSGGADLNIVIRTAVRADGTWSVGTGGAIVLGSDEGGEYRETILKAAAPVVALVAASEEGPRVSTDRARRDGAVGRSHPGRTESSDRPRSSRHTHVPVSAAPYPDNGRTKEHTMIEDCLLDVLACPACKTPFARDTDPAVLTCSQPDCGRRFPVRDGIPVLVLDEAVPGSG